jgi:hypothetical protein
MKRSLRIPSALLSVGLVAALATAAPGTAAAAPAPAAAKIVKTKFAFGASGFGTRVQGGQAPAGSDEGTAFQSLGCTNRAGINRTNFVKETTVPGLGTVTGARTRVWTAKRGDVVSSYSTHRVAEVVIAQGPLGTLTLEGVRSLSRAYHDGTRYRTQSQASVANAVFTPAGGPAREVDVPTPGNPLVIPGLATVRLGGSDVTRLRNGLGVQTDAIDVRVLPTATRTRVAHSSATIQGGLKFGTFRGFSAGIRGRGLADNVKLGHTPLLPMPCLGTGGREVNRSTSEADRAGVVDASNLKATQMARQTTTRAVAWEQGSVGRVVTGDGRVVLRGIVGRAHVVRTRKAVTRSAAGSTVGTLLVDGEEREFPKSGVITIPGLLKIEENVVQRYASGMQVIGARLTLLDGSGAVIDIGVARVTIRR